MNLVALLFALLQLGSVEGVVKQAGPAATPIAGARVKLQDRRQAPGTPTFSTETTTDASGSFRVVDVPAGIYRIEITHDTYSLDARGTALMDSFEVAAGQTVRVRDVLMTAAGTIRGHVRDAEGKGMAGVPVEILRMLIDQSGRKLWQVA